MHLIKFSNAATTLTVTPITLAASALTSALTGRAVLSLLAAPAVSVGEVVSTTKLMACSSRRKDKTTVFVRASKVIIMSMLSTTAMEAVSMMEEIVTAWKKEEEDKKGKLKKSPFSKQEGVVLESENKLILGRKEGDIKLLGEEVRWLFFRGRISFTGGKTKVRGLNLMMGENFSWEINSCFFI